MKYFLLWLLLSLIWGTTWVAIKIGDAYLPPLAFCGMRFALAGPLLLGICALLKKPVLPPRQKGVWRFLILAGILNFAGTYGLIFWSEQYIPSGLAALISSMTTGFTFVLSHLFLPNEKLSWLKVAGLVLGICGIGLIFIDQLHIAGIMAVMGSIAMLVSAICGASFSVAIKAKGQALDPAMMAGWTMLFGSIPPLLIGIAVGGSPLHYSWTPGATLSLLYLALMGSSLAFFIFYYLIRHIDVGKVITTNLVTPIIAVLVGWLVLGETLAPTALAGGALVLAGTALIVRPRLFRSV